MKMQLSIIQQQSNEFMEKEDIHYHKQFSEYVIDNQRIDSMLWDKFIEYFKTQQLSTMHQKTLDKRKTLQTEYQLDVMDGVSVTIFFEENSNCDSIISPFKWVLVKLVEEFNNIGNKQIQCRGTQQQDKGIIWRCLKDYNHTGDCKFAYN